MLVNTFDIIKETLKIADVLTFYGMIFNRNKALCPLHNEKSPSFTIYPSTNSWHCFGCGAGGSVIDFVMALCGLSALDAAKKIDINYSLGLFQKKPSQEELYRLSTQRTAQVTSGRLLRI